MPLTWIMAGTAARGDGVEKQEATDAETENAHPS